METNNQILIAAPEWLLAALDDQQEIEEIDEETETAARVPLGFV